MQGKTSRSQSCIQIILMHFIKEATTVFETSASPPHNWLTETATAATPRPCCDQWHTEMENYSHIHGDGRTTHPLLPVLSHPASILEEFMHILTGLVLYSPINTLQNNSILVYQPC